MKLGLAALWFVLMAATGLAFWPLFSAGGSWVIGFVVALLIWVFGAFIGVEGLRAVEIRRSARESTRHASLGLTE
jgi:hypothetical protein